MESTPLTPKVKELITQVEDALDMYESDPDSAGEILLNTSCKFFRDGNADFCDNPKICNGCRSLESRLASARHFLEWIRVNPMEVYSKGFERPRPRKKKSFEEVASAGFDLGMHCNNCYISKNCPEFSSGNSCSIDWEAPIEDMTPANILDYLIKIQSERVNRAKTQELLDGGVADQNLSGEMDRLSNLVHSKKALLQQKFSVTTTLESSSPESMQKGGGLLAQLFGKKDEPEALPEAEKRIEIDAEDAEAEIIEETPKRKNRKK